MIVKTINNFSFWKNIKMIKVLDYYDAPLMFVAAIEENVYLITITEEETPESTVYMAAHINSDTLQTIEDKDYSPRQIFLTADSDSALYKFTVMWNNKQLIIESEQHVSDEWLSLE